MSMLKKVLLVIFFNQLIWLSAIPYNFAPDEFGHFDVINRWVSTGNYPQFLKDPPDGLSRQNGMVGVSYSALQPLPYIWSGLPLMFTKNFLDQKHWYLYVRLGSALATVIFASGIYWWLNKASPHQRYKWVGVVIAGFIPQVSFIGAYVTSDSPTLAVSVWITAAALTGITNPFIWGALIGIGLLSRYNTYPLIAILALMVAWKWFKQGKFKEIVVSTLLAILLSGWWFLRNWLTLGDILAVRKFYEVLYQIRAFEFHHYGIWQMLNTTSWLEITGKSAFAAFDWNYLFLPNWVYSLVLVVVTIGLGSLIINKKLNFWLTIAFALTVYQSLAQSAYGSYQPQGRHMFAILPAVLFYLWAGWTKLKFEKKLGLSIALGTVAVNIYSLLEIIIPRYYGQGMELTGISLYRQAFWEMVFHRPFPFNSFGLGVIIVVWVFLLSQLVLDLSREFRLK